jgi:hypothetical protein
MKLGRLFVFARELVEDRFSPYVQGMHSMVSEAKPMMFTPLSLRLVETMREREISFTSDIDGYVCITQEIDTAKDVTAKVRMKRIISKHLGWKQRLYRKYIGIFQWPIKITT